MISTPEPLPEHDDEDGPRVWIVEERPPLREGKIFVDADQRDRITQSLEEAYTALNQAFRGIWVEQALEHGHVREYWDEDDIDELETLALHANDAADRAWRALSDVTEAHTTQLDASAENTVDER